MRKIILILFISCSQFHASALTSLKRNMFHIAIETEHTALIRALVDPMSPMLDDQFVQLLNRTKFTPTMQDLEVAQNHPKALNILYLYFPESIQRVAITSLRNNIQNFNKKFVQRLLNETHHFLNPRSEDLKLAKYQPEMLNILEPYFPTEINRIKDEAHEKSSQEAWIYGLDAF